MMTQVQIVKTKHVSLSSEARELLHINELEYGQFIMDMGLKYLRVNMGLSEECIALLITDKIFWNWWKVQWYIREANFIEKVKVRNMPLNERVHIHSIVHSPGFLNNYPHRGVMEDTYAEMMGKMIDSNVQQ